jgi:DNA-binding transcriptional regulator GbsR (MarR family)
VTRDTDGTDGVPEPRERVIEGMARSAEVYGTKRSYGRLFGILYFAEGAMSLDELVAESGYAKSTVSTAMNTLERFHLVRRRSRPGEGKRVFFEAESDFWYVFQQFLDQQVRREIEIMSRALADAEESLENLDDEASQRDLERIRALKDVYDRSETWIDVLTSQPLDRVVSVVERLRGSD